MIDGTGAAPLRDVNVRIAGDRIVAIGPAVAPVKGAQVIDCRGKYLIPGLWDMHVHLWDDEPMFGLYLANGVTGLRDMGSEFARTSRWKREIDAGKRLGPKIFTPGPVIAGPGGKMGKLASIHVANAAEAQRAVDQLDDDGSDFVEVLSNLSRETYLAAAYRARLLRIPFEGHLPDSMLFSEAINARQKSVEHLFGLPLAFSSEEFAIRQDRTDGKPVSRDCCNETFSETKAMELLRQAAIYGVWQCPTLTLRERMALVNGEHLARDPNLKYVPKSVRETWGDPREKGSADANETFQRAMKLIPYLKKARTDILAGTDTGDPYVVPGFALHEELKLLVQAGLTPMEALQAATSNPARFFKLETTLGTVERGKIATLVVLDKNPLEDINNTRTVRAVILKGRLLTRKDLDAMMAVKK